jgi:hypothetical protein
MQSQSYPLLLKKLPSPAEGSHGAAQASRALCREAQALISVSRDLIAGSRRFIDESNCTLAAADMIIKTCLLGCWGKDGRSSQ